MQSSTSIWNAQHPNAGQNIQHTEVVKTTHPITLSHCKQKYCYIRLKEIQQKKYSKREIFKCQRGFHRVIYAH